MKSTDIPGIAGNQSFMTAPAPEDAAGRNRAVALAALFIVGIAAFANLYATQPLLPRFRESFHASELLVSFTVSATVFAVALTAPLIGLFSDRMGRKRVIVAALIGLALATGLSATAANLGQLIVWRFLQGCFVPGIIAVTMAYIAEESQPRSIGATMATYVTGTIIGGFSGRFITGLAVARWDWHAAFVILGAVNLAGGLAAWRLLPRSAKFVRRSAGAAAFGSIRDHSAKPRAPGNLRGRVRSAVLSRRGIYLRELLPGR